MPSTVYTKVLKELLQATHCHGCGRAYHVSLIGYVGKFCQKSCWRGWDSCRYIQGVEEENSPETEDEYVLPDMSKYIDKTKMLCYFGSFDCEHCVSKANDVYRDRKWENEHSPTGVCWPMGDFKRACHNECIRNRQPIDVGRDELNNTY